MAKKRMREVKSGFQGQGMTKAFALKTKKDPGLSKSAEAPKRPVYTTLHIEEAVLVRVPKESGFMVPMSGFKADDGTYVPKHWRNGKPLASGLFLNSFFYGISFPDFGKKILATVEVVQKKMPDGRIFTMLNIRHTPGVTPITELKFPEKTGRGFEIVGSNQEIEFRLRSTRLQKTG